MAQQPKTRTWKLEAYEDEYGNVQVPSYEALVEEMVKLAGMAERLGGVFYIGTDRVEVDDGEYVTAGYLFKWESFAPARRAPEPIVDDDAAIHADLSEASKRAIADLEDEDPLTVQEQDPFQGDEPRLRSPEGRSLTPEEEGELAHQRAAEAREEAKDGVFGDVAAAPREAALSE